MLPGSKDSKTTEERTETPEVVPEGHVSLNQLLERWQAQNSFRMEPATGGFRQALITLTLTESVT